MKAPWSRVCISEILCVLLFLFVFRRKHGCAVRAFVAPIFTSSIRQYGQVFVVGAVCFPLKISDIVAVSDSFFLQKYC